MSKDLQRRYRESQAENQRLVTVIESLQLQIKQSNDANAELRHLLQDLQAKLDVLIAQTKKRNKRE